MAPAEDRELVPTAGTMGSPDGSFEAQPCSQGEIWVVFDAA